MASALKNNIKHLAITEHYPLPDGADPTNDSAMTWEDLPAYCADLQAARANFPQFSLIFGTELDYLGAHDTRDLTQDALAFFDYRLLSVHFIDAWPFDNVSEQKAWEERGIDALWLRYKELWVEAACSAIPAQTMAHPDLIKKFAYYPRFDMQTYFAEMAEAAHDCRKMIEINTAGLCYPCAEVYPSMLARQAFCHAEVPCCGGSDTHSPEGVGKNIELAYKIMYEAGYRQLAVPLAGGEVAFMSL